MVMLLLIVIDRIESIRLPYRVFRDQSSYELDIYIIMVVDILVDGQGLTTSFRHSRNQRVKNPCDDLGPRIEASGCQLGLPC